MGGVNDKKIRVQARYSNVSKLVYYFTRSGFTRVPFVSIVLYFSSEIDTFFLNPLPPKCVVSPQLNPMMATDAVSKPIETGDIMSLAVKGCLAASVGGP